MPNTPYWSWCAMPGAARSTSLTVDQTTFGDGYNHRATRGLNPAKPQWTLAFPFVSLDELQTLDDFLVANAARGFWMRPPDSAADIFVTVDTWSATITDKNGSTGMIGTLQATFVRQFNPQPTNPT